MKKFKEEQLNKKLDTITDLLKRMLALELYRSGTSMDNICHNLRASKTVVVKMLKGVKRNNKDLKP